MKYSEFKSDLIELIQKACLNEINFYANFLKIEEIYAFTLFTASGCTSLGVSLSTFESLERRNEEGPNFPSDDFFNKMNASEWKYLTSNNDSFKKVNALIDQFYDTLFDGEFDDLDMEVLSKEEYNRIPHDFFTSVITEALINMKNSGFFSKPPFISDLLLGLQFADPSIKDLDMMEEISGIVNSPFWHANVVKNCNYIRSLDKPTARP